jgi:hypothetical protein
MKGLLFLSCTARRGDFEDSVKLIRPSLFPFLSFPFLFSSSFFLGSIVTKACHTAELPFVFGFELLLTQPEMPLSNAMMAAWSSFAQQHAPTLSPSWPAFGSSGLRPKKKEEKKKRRGEKKGRKETRRLSSLRFCPLNRFLCWLMVGGLVCLNGN